MIILHAHWHPSHPPVDPGGVVLWAETGDGPAPPRARGRPSARPRPKPHPFCLDHPALRALDVVATSAAGAVDHDLTLRLPTTRTGPLPSPELWHEWELDRDASALAPWTVTAVRLATAEGVVALVGLPSPEEMPPGIRLGGDVRFWRLAAGLVLETVAAEKVVPGLVPGREGHEARWLPVLDGPDDAARLSRLAAAMPTVARAEWTGADGEPPAPDWLVGSFVHLSTDALVRAWSGGPAALAATARDGTPEARWLEALVADDPRIAVPPAPLESLRLGHVAWLRDLEVAGDATFRVAFRLEAPTAGDATGRADASVTDPPVAGTAGASDAGPPVECSAGASVNGPPVAGRVGALATDPPVAGTAGASVPRWRLHYLLQARDDPSLLIGADEVWRTRGRVIARLGRRFDQPQERLLVALGHAARLFPPVAEDLKVRRPVGLALGTGDAYTFLRQAAPALEAAGFGVLVPPWWNRPGARLGLRLKLRSKGSTGGEAGVGGEVSLDRLVGFQWQVALGDTALSRDEFEALVALKTPLVQIRGQWVSLDPEQIEAAIRFWERRTSEGEVGLLDAVRLGLGAETAAGGLPLDRIDAEGTFAAWLARLTGRESMAEVPTPSGLLGDLRPYQRRGFSWLDFLRRAGLGACLADDMGLGKTIQTLALLLHEAEQGGLPGPSLLVSPTSVVTNWEREIQRFAPSLRAIVHQGPERLRGEAFLAAAAASDVVLTSYAVVRRDVDTLGQVPWHAVVADEAQNIKNAAARQARALRGIPAEVRIALTGTPVENRLSELWSIMHFLNPGYLGPLERFRRDFAVPIERYGDEEARDRLRQLVGPFVLRRLKSDPAVISDLPDKVETKVFCALTAEQVTLYQAVVEDVMQKVGNSEGIERKGLVLSMLGQLKAICNHPQQYLHQHPDDRGPDASAALTARSGKLGRLEELLEEVIAAGDRALVFTQFAEMGQLLHDWVTRALGCGAIYLHGGVPAARRRQLVDRFQSDDGPPVFVLSLKAGGTGLNLTRANHVFHFDRWWNPAVEDQATDRAYRIGQQKNVQVHKFVTLGTMEEMIDEMIERKKGLAEAVIGTGEGWLTELSTEALHDLVRLRANA